MTEYADIDKLLSELRHGHSCLLLNENSAGGMTGFVVVAAEHCEAEHIAFMARQARGLVCLAMTPQRCKELELPLMVEGDDSLSPFTLSIEAATGIDTGISAADRARTVRVAVDAASQASDLVQPGHIFPIAAAAGGVLTRTAPAEAAMDLATLAGLLPSAVFAEVLDNNGDVADADYLVGFANQHQLVVGQVSDLVTYRLANQKTIPLCGGHTANPARRVQRHRLSGHDPGATPRGTDKGCDRCGQAHSCEGSRHFSIPGSGWHDPRWPRFMVLRCQPQSDRRIRERCIGIAQQARGHR